MSMKTIALEQATGPAIDLLVATCEGHLASVTKSSEVIILREGVTDYFDPHRNWGWAGPIIERERISIRPDVSTPNFRAFVIRPPEGLSHRYIGPTPLIAAMRCYVASKLGDEVEVPEELE